MKLEIGIPCYRYHAENGAKLIKTQEELDALDDYWVDTPAKLKADESGPKEKKAPMSKKAIEKFIDYEDLTVLELKALLIDERSFDSKRLSRLKKKQLIALAEGK